MADRRRAKEACVSAIVALIHGVEGAYGISFPDFRGCVSGGTTVDEALRRGAATLASHIEAMSANGDPLPMIRDMAAITADPDLAEDIAEAISIAAIETDLPDDR
ncbi:type II toxin-antitoxin system HicB family antitoxin [Phreatobacter stygius]|uniref:HicB family protein n=1 Tax=Phreatobacter stygius TaxID=1940610 RepID=A0A4D7B785_9HYPH|nr:type II toxin-antitoxin system HicB family antitoxin [Phreatobacter stygius]QCI68841.1 HicB family protein [Phreatobacter stygius]